MLVVQVICVAVVLEPQWGWLPGRGLRV